MTTKTRVTQILKPRITAWKPNNGEGIKTYSSAGAVEFHSNPINSTVKWQTQDGILSQTGVVGGGEEMEKIAIHARP